MKFSEYTIGQQFTCPPVSVTLQEIKDYALKYDPLPIHLDDEFVKTTRFKKIFASGFQTLNVTWASWVKMGYWNEDVIAGMTIEQLQWLLPVYPDDQLTPIVTIEDLIPTSSDKQGIVVINMRAHNQDNKDVIDVTFKALVSKK